MISPSHNIPHALKNLFGKKEFRTGQREIIEASLAGRSCIGVLPTGSGKSLCYQLPSILLDGVSLVVSPLIALMKDQADALTKLGISTARFDSTLSEQERDKVLTSIAKSSLKLVFVAPESLDSPAFSKAFSQAQPGLFIIDEAHCLSEWGHSFRPDYLALPRYAKTRPFHAILALTATATPKVIDDLASMFHVQESDIFRQPPLRTNISRSAVVTDNKLPLLADMLSMPERVPAIVYVRSRKDTEEISSFLSDAGIRAKSYHAGMPSETRELIQGDFLSGDIPVLVATIAFGMGIDKPDVRSVIHFHPPTSPESYVQESGRAGRDGAPSESLVLMSHADKIAGRNRLYASTPDKESIRMLLSQLLSPGRHVVSIYETTNLCDTSESVFQRVLFDLSTQGLVSIDTKGFKYYRIKPLFPITTILAGRGVDERNILSWLDEHRDSDVEEFALFAGMNWKEACDYLEDLVLSGEWQCTLRQAALELRSSPSGISLPSLVDECTNQFQKKLANDIVRLEKIEHFLEDSPCINSAIDSYFGFESSPCGHCTPCSSKQQQGKAPETKLPPIPLETLEQIADLSRQRKRNLERASQMTRFLLGLPGPAALSGRLWAHPLYGALSGYPWGDVLAASRAIIGQ